MTRQEQFAISKALEKARTIEQSFRLALPLHEVVQNRHGIHSQLARPRGGPAKAAPLSVLDCAFEITTAGKNRSVTVWNGQLRYSTGRQVLAARLLADHGECVLHRSNGKCIGILRDPFVESRPRNRGPRVQHSRNPHDVRQLNAETRAAPRPRIVRSPGRALYSPEQCPNDCRGRRGGGEWALAKGAIPPTDQQHHPICKFAAAWNETIEGVATNAVLYDLELSRIARTALPQEIAEADDAERRTGIRQITVAGRIFAVLPTEEAEQAAAEARGETIQAAPLRAPTPAPAESAHPAEPIDGEFDGEPQTSPGVATEGAEGTAEAGPEFSVAVVDAPGSSAPEDREQWPRLDQLLPVQDPDSLRRRSDVTASSYLSRRAPGAERT